MNIKTSELQALSNLTGMERLLADDPERGTGLVPLSAAIEFFKETFLSGGVPYGKELT